MRDTDNPSRLDLVFSKEENEINNIRYEAPVGLSKHAILIFNLYVEDVEKLSGGVPRYNFHKGDYVKFNELLSGVNWEQEFRNKSTQERWDIFLDYYWKFVKLCVPKFIPRDKFIAPKWMNRKVRNLIAQKRAAWGRYRDRKLPARRTAYNYIRNRVTLEIRKAKRNYERGVALDAKENSKHFWSYVRSKLRIKEQISYIKREDGTLTTTDEETANVFNNAFSNVFVREDPEIPLPDLERNFEGEILSSVNLTRGKVLKHLNKLKTDKACGPDGVSPKVLRSCADIISFPMFSIFMSSLISGEVPQVWRSADIPPIFKKGSKANPLNYRPVSLTSVVVKVLESIVREEIVKHLDINLIITPKQHGFRNKKSCLTNLLEYLDELVDAVDMGEGIDVNYLDCEKAFDRVPHERLMLKLSAVGIGGRSWGGLGLS